MIHNEISIYLSIYLFISIYLGAAPLPSCNIQDLHLLRLLLTAHITQLLFNLEELENTEVSNNNNDDNNSKLCVERKCNSQNYKNIERKTVE